MKILIADDDALSLRLLRRTLERADYEVIQATDGGSAADQLCLPNGPRIALLDWMMPVMDGPEVCRKVRRLRKQQYVHLVMLTSKSSKHDIVEGLESGADDYLTKPFDPPELKARLRTGLRILELEDKLVEAREDMRFKATHDPLTALFNRGAILELLSRELMRTTREKGCTTVLLVDVDHFKRINDRFGHLVGDEALREVARLLLRSCRSYDYVGRYGGEEFLVILNNCEVANSVSRAEEIRRSIESTPISTLQGDLSVTVSIGVLTTRNCPQLRCEDVMREVDLALYAAKDSGRNCIRMARPRCIEAAGPRGIAPPELWKE